MVLWYTHFRHINFASVVYSIIDFTVSNISKLFIFHHYQTAVISAVIFIVYIIGLGLFQANAIQFGLDQLLEAPTPKLISFIHWYYWAQNVGSLALFYISILGSKISDELHVYLITNITSEERYKSLSSVVTTPVLIAWTIILTTVLVKFCTTRKYFYIQKAGLNPFKNKKEKDFLRNQKDVGMKISNEEILSLVPNVNQQGSSTEW